MNSDDHARSVHAKLFAECREENERLCEENERLCEENEALGQAVDIVSDENVRMRAENARLRAALTYIESLCRTVDISDRDMVLDRFADIGATSLNALAALAAAVEGEPGAVLGGGNEHGATDAST